MNRPPEETILEQALALSSPEERKAFLLSVCGDNAALRSEIESLIQAHEHAGRFFGKRTASEGPPASIQLLEEQPGTLIGRYKLREKIGEGGCGVVYVAEQEQPVRRRVALKVIKLGMDTKSVVARFEAERQALAMMDHPCIAKVFDAGTTETGRPYFVMELVRGIKITDFCDQHQLSTPQRLELFIQVCRAVQHAHQKGIIHRDLKPSNILVTLDETGPVPKVIDFGIAKATEGRLSDQTVYTHFHQFIGTPAYMSPEQAEMTALDIDTRSDVYSLGVLLYELLTGRPPFDPTVLLTAGIEQMRKTIREQEPVRPSTKISLLHAEELTSMARRRSVDPTRLTHQIKGDLDWIVMKCLEKDRTRRYETANGLAADLKRHLENEPVVACPPSLAYRLSKSIARHRLAFAAGTAVLLALLAGLALSTWQTLIATRARRSAEDARKAEEKQRRIAVAAQQQAQREQLRAEEMLQSLQLHRAEELFSAHKSTEAISYLAQLLREHPSNQVAATRLASALVFHPFPRSVGPIIKAGQGLKVAEFTPDSTRVLTRSVNSVALWDARSGERVGGPWSRAGEHVNGPGSQDDVVQSAQVSRDGSLILITSARAVEVRRTSTGAIVGGPWRAEDDVLPAEFSPDERTVLIAQRNINHQESSLGVFSLESPTIELRSLTSDTAVSLRLPHLARLVSAHFSPDGKRVLGDLADNSVCLWDAASGGLVWEARRRGTSGFGAIYSPQGSAIYASDGDGSMERLEPGTGTNVATIPAASAPSHYSALGYSRPIYGFISPSEGRLLAASDQGLRLWNLRTGKPLSGFFAPEGVNEYEFSPDGQRLITASADKTAKLWDAFTGRLLAEPMLHDDAVEYARFSADGSRVITACADGTVHIWEVTASPPPSTPLRAPDQILEIKFTKDGRHLLGDVFFEGYQTWDLQTRQKTGLEEPPTRLIIRRGGKTDLRTGVDTSWTNPDPLTMWQLSTNLPLGRAFTNWAREYSLAVRCGDRVATCTGNPTIARLWNLGTGQLVAELNGHTSPVCNLEFDVDAKRLLTVAFDHTVRLWEGRSGAALNPPITLPSNVSQASFSADGRRILIACDDGSVRVWDAETHEAVGPPMIHAKRLNSIALSPDGECVATGGEGESAHLWNARTGRTTASPLRHGKAVNLVLFSPDGASLVTASRDGTCRLWDVQTGEPLSEPIPTSAELVSFNADGSLLATANRQNIARVWESSRAPVPVPSWFIDWVEARVGRPVEASSEEIRGKLDLPRQREQVLGRQNKDAYTLLAQWAERDIQSRSVSPASFLSMPEYVRECAAEDDLESVREAVVSAPASPSVWKRLALLSRAEERKEQSTLPLESEFNARRAVLLNPSDPELWHLLASIQSDRGRLAEARTNIERALAFGPELPELWELHGDLLERDQQFNLALASYAEGLRLLPETNTGASSTRFAILTKRASIYRALGDFEAAKAELGLLGIPARDPATPARLLDLSPFYNASFIGNWHADSEPGGANDLAEVPTGVQVMAGTPFDVRGLVQVGGDKPAEGRRFPERIGGIPVHAHAGKIRFLHSAIWGVDPEGTVIAKYVIHYADGTQAERPVMMGRDLLDWFYPPPKAPATGLAKDLTVAWRGLNAKGRTIYRNCHLYASTWENPRPDLEIATLDVVAMAPQSALFLVAATVD